jgi:hypothetical protein
MLTALRAPLVVAMSRRLDRLSTKVARRTPVGIGQELPVIQRESSRYQRRFSARHYPR